MKLSNMNSEGEEAMTESIGKQQARARQELRRSNAAVPIPAGKHKRSRSRDKQDLREEWR